MSNFFLLNETVEFPDFGLFKSGMSELVAIERQSEDIFRKHISIWNIANIENLYSNFGQTEQAISKFIEQLTDTDVYLDSEKTFDLHFPDSSNAFLGIDFSNTVIPVYKQISHELSYQNFKNKDLWDLTFRNLWSKRTQLFPHLILCGEVEVQIAKIGNSGFFNQIVERLKELDKAASMWNAGDFNYRMIEREYPLRISPETEQTMNKYGNQRLFSLPDGRRKHFELHIKTGELRFHFFADNETHKVYVGYIGPHLDTFLHN